MLEREYDCAGDTRWYLDGHMELLSISAVSLLAETLIDPGFKPGRTFNSWYAGILTGILRADASVHFVS